MKQIIRAFLIMQKVITAVISIALTAMIAVVFLQTFCRFVIFKSLSWSEELSRYLFVAVIVLGVNLAMSNHMMVRIEIIDNYLKGKAAVVMNLVRRFAALFVNIIFMYSAFKLIEIGGYQYKPGNEHSNEFPVQHYSGWICAECAGSTHGYLSDLCASGIGKGGKINADSSNSFDCGSDRCDGAWI